MNAGVLEGFAASAGMREEALGIDCVPAGRLVKAAFEVAEYDVGGAEFRGDSFERNGGIGDVHQVDVTGKDHFERHGGPVRSERRRDKAAAVIICKAPQDGENALTCACDLATTSARSDRDASML